MYLLNDSRKKTDPSMHPALCQRYHTVLEIKNCQFAGTIMTDSTLAIDHTFGGIVGWARNNETTITDCLFTGTIDYGTNNTRIAGILARNGQTKTTTVSAVQTQTTITNVLVDGTITGTSDTATSQYIGYVQGQESLGTITVTAGTAYAEDNVYVNKNSEVIVSLTESTDDFPTFSDADLTGENAEKKVTGLFGTDTVWISQVMGHPVLKSFHWYNPNQTVFTINNVAELYEFAKTSQTANFRHKIVYLGSDIIVNDGTSEEIKANASTALQWTPIGTSASNGYPFAGTFDGQGHIISGLCANAVTGEKALFQGTASTSVIKNLKLINSYFATGFASGVTVTSVFLLAYQRYLLQILSQFHCTKIRQVHFPSLLPGVLPRSTLLLTPPEQIPKSRPIHSPCVLVFSFSYHLPPIDDYCSLPWNTSHILCGLAPL